MCKAGGTGLTQCLESEIAEEVHPVGEPKATRSYVDIIPASGPKQKMFSNRFYCTFDQVRISDLPHLKRGQNQIQHEADVESNLDGIAHPSGSKTDTEPKSFWSFTQCLKCNDSPQLLGVSLALTAHLAQYDKSAEL